MNYALLPLRIFSDERGKLGVLESYKDMPFAIKRMYYIFDTSPSFDRGGHAHRELEQIVLCLCGSCEFVLDNGSLRENVKLNSPEVGLYIGKNMWREMKNFSYDCRLVVLASDYYDDREYIRDYAEFIEFIKEIKCKE
ncbi:sugar 3,4-ketoisomerase [Helicobacter apodemus]|uniref:dTDP-6-deoxy-3,4-keto-hexulose isomerase n=1 Tax=Helicobacter apodemus TaxID=135569 RepID=A0A2U8FER0_9HELI|nr:FdtA/QdtA family cupin domain-containing protein [Helicobacter apodemus]AWI34722.1 dTDP-6-deoxy-3,4-keto-hexulose isomerase [Helicobacter apodemus]